jgi:hypothetical protein
VTGRRAAALVATFTLPTLLFLTVTAIIYQHWRIEAPPRLSPEARADVMATLRAGLAGAPTMPTHPELARRLPDDGPVVGTLWFGGIMAGRVEGYGATIAQATFAAAQLAAVHPVFGSLSPEQKASARWKVDVVIGRGPIDRDHAILNLVALHPGIDGVGVELPGTSGVLQPMLLPDEMAQYGLLAKTPLLKEVPEVGMGVDFKRADQLLAARAQQAPNAWKGFDRRYFRFRTDAFVEAPGAVVPPLQLTRGLPEGPPVTPGSLRAGALAGARYLVNHLGADGRYVYEQNMSTGRTSGGYSLPRHAGTTYFLAEVYRFTKAPWLREPVERAAGLLGTLVSASGCRRTLPDGRVLSCVADRNERIANLGSTSLGLVALVEYQRATDDPRFLPLATELAEWILWMQRSDGSFRHLYDVKTGVADDKAMLLYFSGEAALALARMYAITGEARYGAAAERALDWLVGWYDFFIGGFIYGEEHWTCIAAEALAPYRQKASYRSFCDGLTRFWGDTQARPGDYPDQGDLVGSHNLTPFVMPQNTPAGSHTEARISTYLLGKYAGRPSRRQRQDILETLGYLLRQQIGPHNDFAVVQNARGFGGVMGNPVDRVVRIDYVQHVCSAMIRAVELAEEEEAAAAR